MSCSGVSSQVGPACQGQHLHNRLISALSICLLATSPAGFEGSYRELHEGTWMGLPC